MRTAIKLIGTYIGLSVFLGLMWIFLSPSIPSTPGQWIWIFALALPLQLAGEFVGELLSNNKATHWVEQRTAAKSFSPLRIFLWLLLILMFVGLVLGAAYGWRALRPLLGI